MTTLIKSKWLRSLFLVCYLAISLLTVNHFKGDLWSFGLFSFAFFLFLERRISKPSTYFDIFLGGFFFLGFWAKFHYHVWLDDFIMGDPVGNFKFDRGQFNRLLSLISAGLFGFTLSREIISSLESRLSWRPSQLFQSSVGHFENFYFKNRRWILFTFILGTGLIALLNLKFHIYQRGVVSQASSGAVRSLFTILLLFGLSASFCTFLKFDSHRKGSTLLVTTLLSFLEVYLSSISLLSRGFILNAGSLLLVVLQLQFSNRLLTRMQFASVLAAFSLMMISSIKIVSMIRYYEFELKPSVEGLLSKDQVQKQKSFQAEMMGLVVDRWVGLEGVMAAVGFEGDRKGIFQAISQETMSAGTSLYDKEVAQSIYTKTATQNTQFVSLPGFIGWISILDNCFLTLFSALAIGLFCNLIEICIMRLVGNAFITALFGQVLAYRVSHFGYLPHQSYKLLGGIFLVVGSILFIQVLINRFLSRSLDHLRT